MKKANSDLPLSPAGHPLFRGMEGEKLKKALAMFDAKTVRFDKGETFLTPSDRPERFGIVLKGLIRAYSVDPEGNRMIFANVTPGGSFGEAMCFLRLRESPVWLCAVEPSEALLLSIPAFFDRGGEDPALESELRERFTRVLAARTLEMNRRIQILSKKSLREKILTFFSFVSARTGVVFTLPFDREDMAEYVGADRSALSRELSRMKKEGIIDFHKNTFKILPK